MADKVYNALTDSVYGDINGDKVIDIRDLIRMKKVTAQMEVEYIRANSDIDFDGTVAATDAVVLRRYLVGDEDAIGGNETEKTPVSLEEEMASIS